MWRSFFMALGIFTMILGAETLVVDHVVFATNRRIPAMVTGQPYQETGYSGAFSNQPYSANQSPYRGVGYSNSPVFPGRKVPNRGVFRTKDWMPWSLLAIGAIIVMYTYSLPAHHRSSLSSDD